MALHGSILAKYLTGPALGYGQSLLHAFTQARRRSQGLKVSLCCFLYDKLVECQIGNRFLEESLVFLLQFFEAFHLGWSYYAVLLTPAVIADISDAVVYG